MFRFCVCAAIIVVLLPISWRCFSQASSSPAQRTDMGGIAGGIGAPPVYDKQHRPITAGGFVDHGPVVFRNIAKAAGLTGWQHKMGGAQKSIIVETNGSGVGLIDYDNDGWLHLPCQWFDL